MKEPMTRQMNTVWIEPFEGNMLVLALAGDLQGKYRDHMGIDVTKDENEDVDLVRGIIDNVTTGMIHNGVFMGCSTVAIRTTIFKYEIEALLKHDFKNFKTRRI